MAFKTDSRSEKGTATNHIPLFDQISQYGYGVSEIPDTTRLEHTLLREPDEETVALSGLKRFVPRIRHLRESALDTLGYLAEKRAALAGRVGYKSSAVLADGDWKPAPVVGQMREKARFLLNEGSRSLLEASGRHKNKIYIGIGATAVLGLLTADVGAFTNYFGLYSHDAIHHINEATRQALDHNQSSHLLTTHSEHQLLELDVAPKRPAVTVGAQNHFYGSAPQSRPAENASMLVSHHDADLTVHITPGEGPTQAIKKLFPGHSPVQYLNGFKEVVKMRGQKIFSGIPHYQEGHGLFGFKRTGVAQLSQHAYKTLASFFKRSG